jgi:hypothetical protein
VHLELKPLIVSGRVVDPAGEPAAGIGIKLWAWGGRSWGDISYSFNQPETDGAGGFEFRDPIKFMRYRVEFAGVGQHAGPVEFDPGTAGLVVTLDGAGSLAGTVLLPDGISSRQAEVRLFEPGVGRERFRRPLAQQLPEAQGGFRFDLLAPGTYDVAIMLSVGRTPLHLVEGIRVSAGPETRDVRLDPLDLRDVLHVFRLSLSGVREGEELSGAATFDVAGSTELDYFCGVDDTEVVLLAPHAEIDIALRVDGFRNMMLRGVRGDLELELQRGYRVRVVLAGDGDLPEPPISLSVALVPDEHGWHSVNEESQVFDAQREIVVLSPEAGRRRVRWIVTRPMGLWTHSRTLDADPPQVIEIADHAREQRIEVRLTAEQLQQLVELITK